MEHGLSIAPRQCTDEQSELKLRFLDKEQMNTLANTPKSTPCDFFLFPIIKSWLKGTPSLLIKDTHYNTAELIKAISNKTGKACINVTWRCVRIATVAVRKQ